MPTYLNRAHVYTATIGTGTLTLGSAVLGYQTFTSAGIANGNVVSYTIEDIGSAWEVGVGTYTSSGNTLTRTLVQSSTGSLLNLTGQARVYVIMAAADMTALLNTATIGVSVQAYDAALQSISGLTTSANQLIYTTASDTYTTASLTAAGRALLDDADAAAQRTTLGLVIGTNVQAYDAGLQSISGLTTAADTMIYTTALDTYTTATLTAAGRALLDDVDTAAQRTTLGLVIGTNVQAYDAALQSISGLTTAANQLIYTTAADTYTTASLTAAGRALLDDADTAAQRTTLGLVIGTDVQAWDANLDQIAALAPTADNFIVGNGSAWVLETPAQALASLGVTATAAELNYVDGVTSAVQTQLDAKVPRTATTGSAALPAGTTGERDGTPAAGYFRFNSTLGVFEGYNGTNWGGVGGATGGGSDRVFYENGQIVTASYTITSGTNAMSAGPISINSGVTVTVPTGSVWTVI